MSKASVLLGLLIGFFSTSVFAAELNDFLGCYGNQGCNIKVSVQANIVFDANKKPIPALYFSSLQSDQCSPDILGWNFGATPVALDDPHNISISTDGSKLVAKTNVKHFWSDGSPIIGVFGEEVQGIKITAESDGSYDFYSVGGYNTGLELSSLKKIACPAQ